MKKLIAVLLFIPIFIGCAFYLKETTGKAAVIAHAGGRCFSGSSLENIEYSKKWADIIEIDVRITNDRIPVIYHDTYINDRHVGSYTYNELLTVDPDVKTLGDIFQVWDKEFLIDLKDKNAIIPVLDLIKESGIKYESFYVSTDNFDVVKTVNDFSDKITTLIIVDFNTSKQPYEVVESYLKQSDADGISAHRLFSSRENIEKIQSLKKTVFIWALDSDKEISTAIVNGPNGVISDCYLAD